jgi:DNA-binding transcriptional ArsR family regulator
MAKRESETKRPSTSVWDTATLADVVQVAKALADESRVRVLMALGGAAAQGCCGPSRDEEGVGELCLCQIVDLLGLAPSTVSRHMNQLQTAGLVRRRKAGKWHYFHLAGADASPAAAGALAWIDACLSASRDADHLHRQLCCVREKDLAELTACYG